MLPNLTLQFHLKNPIFTSQIGTLGSVSLLEAIENIDKEVNFIKHLHEMYGGSKKESLKEDSSFDLKALTLCFKTFALK